MIISPTIEELIDHQDEYLRITDVPNPIYDTHTVYIKAIVYYVLRNEEDAATRITSSTAIGITFVKIFEYSNRLSEINRNLIVERIEEEKINLIKEIKSHEFNTITVPVYDDELSGEVVGEKTIKVNELIIHNVDVEKIVF